MKKGKKRKILRRNFPVIKSVESILRPEESLWCERFVEEVGSDHNFNFNIVSDIAVVVKTDVKTPTNHQLQHGYSSRQTDNGPIA